MHSQTMNKEELLKVGSKLHRDGNLRESAWKYLEYIEGWVSEQKEFVGKGSIEEETSLKDIRFVIAKLEDVYSELKKSAAALPPLNYTSNNTAQFGRDKGVGARENLSETSERQKAAQISNVTISGIIESRRERTSKTQREETPEIPLSKLTRELIKLSRIASRNNEKIKKMKTRKNKSALSRKELLGIFEQEKIGVDKVQKLYIHMQITENLKLEDIDIGDLAREISRIDAELFSKVDIVGYVQNNRTCVLNGKRMVDFGIYLRNFIAQQLISKIYIINLEGGKERENQYREYEEKYTLLAKILIQLYGDFNGGTAVLQGLSRTELNRLRKGEIAGVHSSQPLIQTINEWKWAGSILDVDTYTTDGYFEHIFTFLEQKKKELTELKFKGRLLASIPYMKHHEDEIRKLYQEYTFMHSHNNGNEEKLVTGPGAELLKAHEDLMKSCYYDNTADGDIQGSQPIKESVSTSVLGLPGGKTEHKNIVKAIGMLLFSENEVPIYQDLTIQHWLLTRPYLDGAELWKLSTRVLPIRLSDEQYFSPKNNVNYDQMQPNMMTFEELSEDEYYSNQDSATDAELIVNFDALL